MYGEMFTIFQPALTLWPLVGEGGDDGLHPRPALGVRPHVGEGAAPAQWHLSAV